MLSACRMENKKIENAEIQAFFSSTYCCSSSGMENGANKQFSSFYSFIF
jgi:hypothetical protein